MAIFIGIKPGDKIRARAGTGKPTLNIAVNQYGDHIIINRRVLILREQELVFWHAGIKDSWHGVKSLEDLKIYEPDNCPDLIVDMDSPYHIWGNTVESLSHGTDMVLLISEILPAGYGIVTSNCKGEQRLHIIKPNKVTLTTPERYRQNFKQ